MNDIDKEFKMTIGTVLLGVLWILMLGFLGPFLISAASTELVILGFVLFGVLVYATINWFSTGRFFNFRKKVK